MSSHELAEHQVEPSRRTEQARRVIEANRAYAESFGARAELASTPRRRLALLTCMDARMDPLRLAGLELGDAHVVRNAGGRANDDAIRSLVVSHAVLGTNEWMVIHHTDCGMERVDRDGMRERLTALVGADRARQASSTEWLEIDDRVASVREDVERLRSHPLVPEAVTITGYLYDVDTGLLTEVVGAAP